VVVKAGLSISAGKPIKYDVNIRGEPVPTVQWYQNDVELKPEELPSNTEIKNITTIRKLQ